MCVCVCGGGGGGGGGGRGEGDGGRIPAVYVVAYLGIFITVNYQQTINLDPVTLSRT